MISWLVRFLFITALLIASPALASELYTGPVERVIDGDTIIMQGDSIRIWGINTPEKDEPGFSDAASFIESLTDGSELNCLVHYIDYFKRPVASCEIHGQDLGALMVSSGMAKDYRKYSKGHYSKEQEQAKESGRGLWGEVWN